MNKDDIIAELRRVAELLETSSLTQKQFCQYSDLNIASIEYEFGTWKHAIETAGLFPVSRGPRPNRQQNISDEEYLQEIIRLTRLMGRHPTYDEMNEKGRFSTSPYIRRWGTWNKACEIAYEKYGNPLSKTEALGQREPSAMIPRTAGKVTPETEKHQQSGSRKKVQYGEPMDFRGLRHAPINEQGVVYLFGMVSRELGFLIESVKAPYPDCEGKRRVDQKGQRWERVLIEFEYQSSNFRLHRHDPEGCDLIVCWIHDWEDCPIEVLELRSAIKYLPHQ